MSDAPQPEVRLSHYIYVCLDANRFVLLSFYSLLKTIYPIIWTRSLSNDGKSQLPVDVHLSKTLLLKLLINLPNSFMFRVPGTSRFSFKRWMSRLIWAFLRHSWDSFLRTPLIGVKRWACRVRKFQAASLSHCLCFFWGGGGRGSLLHLHRFESCREVCYTSFYLDNSYGMVIRLLLVTSYSIAHGILHSSLFSSIFTKHKKLFFCGYPSRYPSWGEQRELKGKTKLFEPF